MILSILYEIDVLISIAQTIQTVQSVWAIRVESFHSAEQSGTPASESFVPLDDVIGESL
jgi:hypothetical protein